MFSWRRNKGLDEEARKERGRLAEAIVQNDMVRHRLDTSIKDGPVASMLHDVFKLLDEAKSRG